PGLAEASPAPLKALLPDQQRIALAATTAQGDGCLAAAAAVELVGCGHEHAGPGAADRVAQGDAKIGRASCRERGKMSGGRGRRRHTRSKRDWSSDVCSSDLLGSPKPAQPL